MENRQALEYCSTRYKRTKGFEFNLNNPQYFTEKIQWKKFFDHNPLYTATSDKLMIYEYLKEIGSPVMPPKLLIYTNKPTLPPGLPERWIAKANHGSGWNLTYKEKNPRRLFKEWLSQRYAPQAGEWAYEDIEPYIIFQEWLNKPREYKFFVFSGKIGLIQHITYGAKPKITNYDKDWNKLDFSYVYEQGEVTDRPAEYDEMVKAAEFLGIFPFARIDFMVTEDGVYLSEITHYPTSGFAVIKPLSFDKLLGEQWTK